MSKVVVIGAGASGIVAALKASEKNEVILVDGNDKCGKKILLTGNGRCNYWNSNIHTKQYQTDNMQVLEKILESKEQVLEYLNHLGIYPKIKNELHYPYSNQASSIQTIFENELKRRNIKILNNCKVISIIKKEKQFVVISNDDEIVADKLVLATGSKAFSKTGSDGSCYEIIKNLGHTINPVLPSLVPLKTDIIQNCNGVRCDAKISLYINDELVKEETGELQLTDYGVSGICILNLSGIVSKNLYLKNKVDLKINFLPTIPSFYDWFSERNEELKNHTILELLESIFPYKLLFAILKKANIKNDATWHQLSEIEKQRLCTNIESFHLKVIDTLSFDRAQVCTGGVSLNEIKATMESKMIENLYFVGEVLDVDGICGGFNLAFAFISGYIAGSDIND